LFLENLSYKLFGLTKGVLCNMQNLMEFINSRPIGFTARNTDQISDEFLIQLLRERPFERRMEVADIDSRIQDLLEKNRFMSRDHCALLRMSPFYPPQNPLKYDTLN